jgi:hypothetical protein
MYSDNVMQAIRQNLELDPEDNSRDSEIFKMPRLEVLEKCLNWEGIVGYSGQIISYIEDIYGITLETNLDSL